MTSDLWFRQDCGPPSSNTELKLVDSLTITGRPGVTDSGNSGTGIGCFPGERFSHWNECLSSVPFPSEMRVCKDKYTFNQISWKPEGWQRRGSVRINIRLIKYPRNQKDDICYKGQISSHVDRISFSINFFNDNWTKSLVLVLNRKVRKLEMDQRELYKCAPKFNLTKWKLLN